MKTCRAAPAPRTSSNQKSSANNTHSQQPQQPTVVIQGRQPGN